MAENTEKHPYAVQGAALEKARAGRPMRELLAGWVDPRSGSPISIPRYQHWEYGDNAVPPRLWPELSRRLGIDVGQLYGGASSASTKPAKGGGKMVRASVLLPLVRDAQTRLKVLEALLVDSVPNKEVRQAIRGKRGKQPA